MLCSKQHFRCNKCLHSSSPFCKCLLVIQTIDALLYFSYYTDFQGNTYVSKINSTDFFLIIILHCFRVEVQLFLRLPTTCLLVLVVLLICHSAFSSWEVEGERVKKFIWKYSNSCCSKVTNVTSWPDHCWSLTKRVRERCNGDSSGSHSATKSALCFPIMKNYIQHFAYHVHFITKTKSLSCLCWIRSPQETESSFKLGT